MMGSVGDQESDVPRYGICQRSEVAEGDWRLPAEIAEGCALDKIVDRELRSRVVSHVRDHVTRSRGDETRDHVTELRVRDDGMAV
jgi:hypothetical protein